MACGQAGMVESEFWACELREIFNRINGFYELRHTEQRVHAELTRAQTAALLSVYAKKGRKVKPADIWKFPWDEDGGKGEGVRIMTPEERKDPKADAFMRRIMKKKKHGAE